jgi:hypothetical protein
VLQVATNMRQGLSLQFISLQVMDANQEKNAAERIHLEVSQAFNEMQEKKTRLQKSLKSVIHKTRYNYIYTQH